jgi:hypothetical protein
MITRPSACSPAGRTRRRQATPRPGASGEGEEFDTPSRRSLTKLRDTAGYRFRSGVVLYTGRQTVPLGDRLWAVPVSGL